jgi:phenylalanyl-tRNA synthetase beta chain
VCLGERVVGYVGELHPRWRQAWELPLAPVLFELELDAVLQRPVPRFAPVPKHQAVERDLAVVVAEAVTHGAIMGAIQAALPSDLLRHAVLFDVFRPQQGKVAQTGSAGLEPGEKSLAVRLTLGGHAPLTEADIEAAVQAVLAQLKAQVGARLRA